MGHSEFVNLAYYLPVVSIVVTFLVNQVYLQYRILTIKPIHQTKELQWILYSRSAKVGNPIAPILKSNV